MNFQIAEETVANSDLAIVNAGDSKNVYTLHFGIYIEFEEPPAIYRQRRQIEQAGGGTDLEELLRRLRHDSEIRAAGVNPKLGFSEQLHVSEILVWTVMLDQLRRSPRRFV